MAKRLYSLMLNDEVVRAVDYEAHTTCYEYIFGLIHSCTLIYVHIIVPVTPTQS